MNVLVAYPFAEALPSDDNLLYAPGLAHQNEAALIEALDRYRPDTLVVGNNKLSGTTLTTWRTLMGNEVPLSIVRRGTSLARIDRQVAGALHIDVLNTPGVNALFVAQYMLKQLGIMLADGAIPAGSKRIAVIGSGGIGARIARTMAVNGYEVLVYSPSLADPRTGYNALQAKELNSSHIHIAASAIEAVHGAAYIAIAIDAEKVGVHDRLTPEFVHAVGRDARVMNVSENKVFTDEARQQLLWRAQAGELMFFVDSTPADIRELQELTQGNLTNIQLTSLAMKEPGCQQAMDQAAQTVLADLCLNRTMAKGMDRVLSLPLTSRPQTITIVGAGINGLLIAFLLNRQGHTITLVDAQPELPENSSFFSDSTTWGSKDARHASVTETTPHAAPARRHVLNKKPDQGGWQLRDDLSVAEGAWVGQFQSVADSPELQQLFTRLVADINRHGIGAWQYLLTDTPELLAGVRISQRIVRLYNTQQELAKGLAYQSVMHREQEAGELVKLLSEQELGKRFPGISDGIAGGIEVDGFALNCQTLCINLCAYLQQRGVHFRWNSKVSQLSNQADKTVVSLENGEVLYTDKAIVTARQGLAQRSGQELPVQHVMGCWLELPNLTQLTEGFKIHSAEPVGVINITPSADGKTLYFSGGFGYVGVQAPYKESPAVQALMDKVAAAAERYMPEQYHSAKLAGTLEHSCCVRPMTPDGLPVVTTLNGQKNQLYCSGTNAGGFVAAPILATLIAAIIDQNPEMVYLQTVLDAKRTSSYGANRVPLAFA